MMERLEPNVIQTQGLSKAYKGTKVLDQLNLNVSRNSIFGFLGPNGAGKSTTIKLLLGLIRPTEGKAAVFGQDIQQESVGIRRRIGYLAQDPRYYEHLTARQTLRYTARFFYSGPKELIEARVEEMLELVDLQAKADRPVRGFSGGERQRLGIAQAQVNYPDLLILDEPAASLDPMGRHDVLAVMEKLRKYTTVFYSTHILEDVQRVSDTVAILDRGRLIAEDSIATLLAGDASNATYVLKLKGAPGALSAAAARVAGQPWVHSLNASSENSLATWQMRVSDDQAADDGLLRMVLEDRGIQVQQYGRKTVNLEDVFLKLVGKEN